MTRERFAKLVVVARWAFAVWILAVTLPVFFYPPAIRAFTRAGLPDWFRLALGGSETVAALLLLWPQMWRVGAWGLAGVFAVAIGVHVRLRFPPHALLIYLVTVMTLLWLDSRSTRAGLEV